jgi:hypothetical protein
LIWAGRCGTLSGVRRLRRRPSQILSDKIKDIEAPERRAETIFKLHRVAKISKHFQGSPIFVGDSTQHERNKETTSGNDRTG